MALKEVQLPKLGESITDATVLKWFKKVGDSVREDEILLEVATDKVNSEIPCPFNGIIKELCVDEEQMVNVGDVLCRIETGAKEQEIVKEKAIEQMPTRHNETFYSPSVMRALKEHGLSVEVLGQIIGSGEGGRITKEDIEHFAKRGNPHKKVSTFRKAAAENLMLSITKIPQASLTQLCNVTKTYEFVEKNKHKFLEQHGFKLTLTVVIAHAIVQTIQAFELVNSEFKENQIDVKKEIHLGMAANTEKGVVVPVIKDAQAKDFFELGKAIDAMKQKVQNNRLANSDVEGGTITFTNFGMSGVLLGTPIIKYPQCSIIGVGALHDHVFVKEGQLAPGKALYLTYTFDHRVFDGMYGCHFLTQLQKKVEHAYQDLA
jgi:2-oxoglutarate dehydrogenase E2 component (dihydrolipoamide succinyltransferase)